MYPAVPAIPANKGILTKSIVLKDESIIPPEGAGSMTGNCSGLNVADISRDLATEKAREADVNREQKLVCDDMQTAEHRGGRDICIVISLLSLSIELNCCGLWTFRFLTPSLLCCAHISFRPCSL